MNVLFRCDGSVEVGMGHVVRCLALADFLKKNRKYSIYFAMRKSAIGINTVKESYPVFESNERFFNYEDWLSGCIKLANANILIMDMRDGLTRVELNRVKEKTQIKVITIDDPEDKRLEADLAFYPPVPQLKKTKWQGFNGELRIGWEYVILRKEFSQSFPKPNNDIANIFICMGGTDATNMTEYVINTLKDINKKFKAVVTVGSGYPYVQELRNTLNSLGYRYELHQNPDNLAAIMSKADFAIISFGQIAYELAALHIPAIYLCISDDHFESSKLFMNEGIGFSLGVFSKVKKYKLVGKVISNISNKDIVKDMSVRAANLKISDLNEILINIG
jgi:UDP-2,4-diacetamido-2,4,6-trideoxy-beta-L-altropyranose hydrolase